jgi:hypothetical protein
MRNAAKVAPPLLPPTLPTSGPSRAKRARLAVKEDVCATLVNKGKAEAKAEEVVAAEEEEEPEVENLGEAGEQNGDDDWYDPD